MDKDLNYWQMMSLQDETLAGEELTIRKNLERMLDQGTRAIRSFLSKEREIMILSRVAEMQRLDLPKRSLEDDFQEALENQNMRWALGNFPFLLGHISEYAQEELRSCGLDIFIHNNMIYYEKGDTPLHANTVYCLNNAIRDALSHAGLVGLDGAAAGRSFLLINLLGCRSIFGKVPDAGFTIVPRNSCIIEYPVLVSEIAVTHENLDILLYEGAAWLSERTPVQYFLGYYFHISSEFNMRVILMRRITEAAKFKTKAEHEKTYNSLIGKYQPKKSSCRELESDSKISKMPKRELEERYAVIVLSNIAYDENDFENGQYQGDPLQFDFPTSVLIEGTGNPMLPDYQLVTSLIHEARFFNVVYSRFHETYVEQQRAQIKAFPQHQ